MTSENKDLTLLLMPNFNGQKGAIPLLVLVAIGVAALVGGSYAIKSEFIKFEEGEISLDMTKVQKQQAAPQPPSSPQNSPSKTESNTQQVSEPTPQLAPSKVTVEANTEKEQPGFTINPPAGWNKVEKNGFAAYFEAPEEDKAKMDGVQGGTQKSTATIQIRFMPFNYKQLKESGLAENSILDKAMEAIKKSMDPAAPTYLTDKRTTFAGQDAQQIEAKVTIKMDTSQIEEYKDLGKTAQWDIRTYGYYFVKGNYIVTVSGTSLDDAWGKRAGQIQASINSFSFTK